jgi:hypothetical protein
VPNRKTASGHSPRYEPAVAAKPDDLGAHDGGRQAKSQFFQPDEPALKRDSLHVSLVTAGSEAAQFLAHPDIADSSLWQFQFQGLFVELRIAPGAREMTNVYERLDPKFVE